MSKDQNAMNHGVIPGTSFLTIETNPDFSHIKGNNEIECTVWGVEPIKGETRYVLNPEHRNNTFSSMLYSNISIIPANIMVGILDTFKANLARDLKGLYKITIEKID